MLWLDFRERKLTIRVCSDIGIAETVGDYVVSFIVDKGSEQKLLFIVEVVIVSKVKFIT
jgi:hypothetical protein